MKEVLFKVQMSCGGCSGAVTRILKKIEGTFSSFWIVYMCCFRAERARIELTPSRTQRETLHSNLRFGSMCWFMSISSSGVDGESIEANLETQEVKVSCDDEVDPQTLLVALQKWATASNKTVELMPWEVECDNCAVCENILSTLTLCDQLEILDMM